jgi:hypothetical protein
MSTLPSWYLGTLIPVIWKVDGWVLISYCRKGHASVSFAIPGLPGPLKLFLAPGSGYETQGALEI